MKADRLLREGGWSAHQQNMKSSFSDTEFLLEWVKVNDWLMVTKCGRFRCRKFYLGDVLNDPGECHYQIFDERGLTIGPPTKSFSAARNALR